MPPHRADSAATQGRRSVRLVIQNSRIPEALQSSEPGVSEKPRKEPSPIQVGCSRSTEAPPLAASRVDTRGTPRAPAKRVKALRVSASKNKAKARAQTHKKKETDVPANPSTLETVDNDSQFPRFSIPLLRLTPAQHQRAIRS